MPKIVRSIVVGDDRLPSGGCGNAHQLFRAHEPGAPRRREGHFAPHVYTRCIHGEGDVQVGR